ncbi:MAG: hypothetical protein ABI405_12320 [Parafilimonas sp.]
MKNIMLLLCLFTLNIGFAQKDTLPLPAKPVQWLKAYDFNISEFKSPPKQFGPMARWWWPGQHIK